VYSLRWLHKAEPPDFELVLAQQDAELLLGMRRFVNCGRKKLRTERGSNLLLRWIRGIGRV
jgi:hypothetical protein